MRICFSIVTNKLRFGKSVRKLSDDLSESPPSCLLLPKVNLAESRGAAGVILYTDPADVAVMGPEAVYSSTLMMPPDGVQQGTVKLMHGDPLTPHYPATGDALGGFFDFGLGIVLFVWLYRLN